MRLMLRILLFVGLASLLLAATPAAHAAAKKAAASTTKAGSATKAAPSGSVARDPYLGAIVVDAATGKVLFEDRADAKGYPASVLKLMDLLLIEEKLQQNQLTLQTQVPVSANAAAVGESSVNLKANESFTLDEMLYALMVKSANDVAVALAEKVGGTTDGFLKLMNQKAQALGMTNTIFHTVNGLPPARGQEHDITTARELALLCLEVLKYPEVLRYTSTRQRAFRPGKPDAVNMTAHNHLLDKIQGCDGLKTGWITSAGYSIAVTAQRQGRRVVVVVLGSSSLQTRDARAAELVEKGFALLPAAPAPAAPAPTKAAPAKK